MIAPPPGGTKTIPALRRPPPQDKPVLLFPAAFGTIKIDYPPGPLRSHGGVGFIDTSGKVVIGPKFAAAKEFSEGLAPAGVLQGYSREPTWGYIDATGEFVIPPQFPVAEPFSEGLAAIQDLPYGKNWGYIDRSGRVVIDPAFSNAPYIRLTDATPFAKEGVCFAVLGWGEYLGSDHNYTSVLINTRGEVIREYLGQKNVSGAFQDGLLLIREIGYIDSRGVVKIKTDTFHSAEPFSDGMAAVSRSRNESTLEYGYIDTSGRLLISYQYEDVLPFYEGSAWVREFGGPWKIIDIDGNEVSPKQFDFDTVYPFSEGRALIRDGDAYALVDMEGGLYSLQDPVFQEAKIHEYLGFRNGLAELYLRTPNAYIQVYIDQSGRVVWRSDQHGTLSPEYMEEGEYVE